MTNDRPGGELPPEDQPHTIDIGPVKGIPIHYDDDPRFEAERRARSLATAKAQAMHSPDELLAGLLDPDWMVRIEVIDRLIARGRDDPRTVPALITAAESDASPDIRSTILMRLHRFQSNRVIDLLRSAPITDRAAFPVHNVTIPRAAS